MKQLNGCGKRDKPVRFTAQHLSGKKRHGSTDPLTAGCKQMV
jgi:hypothetical protein